MTERKNIVWALRNGSTRLRRRAIALICSLVYIVVSFAIRILGGPNLTMLIGLVAVAGVHYSHQFALEDPDRQVQVRQTRAYLVRQQTMCRASQQILIGSLIVLVVLLMGPVSSAAQKAGPDPRWAPLAIVLTITIWAMTTSAAFFRVRQTYWGLVLLVPAGVVTSMADWSKSHRLTAVQIGLFLCLGAIGMATSHLDRRSSRQTISPRHSA
jgi:hypothetical protein